MLGPIALVASVPAASWFSVIVQSAGSTAEPELVAGQSVLLGTPLAIFWLIGLVRTYGAAGPSRVVRLLVAGFPAVPCALVVVAVLDVLIEVCARAGGRCG